MPFNTSSPRNAGREATETRIRKIQEIRSGQYFKTPDINGRNSATGNSQRATQRGVQGFRENTSAISQSQTSASARAKEASRNGISGFMERKNKIDNL